MVKKLNKFFSRENFYNLVKWFIWVSLLFAFIGAIFDRNFFTLFLSVFAFLLTLIPYLLKDKFKIKLPQTLELLIIFFIYATLFLGEIENFYNVFWWWDIFMHGISAIALGFIGIGLLYEMDRITAIKANLFSLVFFGFCFAVAIGTLWEIFEFVMDMTFGTNMLKSGLMDTFGDLIVDVLGALFAAVISYRYIKRKKGKKI